MTGKRRRIAVVGGGASGMMAAITAAGMGCEVTILEGNDRLGQKILATGNGKCNLGNRELSQSQYHGGDARFIGNALQQFGTDDTIRFFEGLGLLIKDRNGYLYPLCEQASVVLDVLREEVDHLGISVICDCMVKAVQKDRERFCVIDQNGKKYSFDRVILSCGGCASLKKGFVFLGYDITRKLGLEMIPTVPALTNLKCRETWFKAVSGVRADAVIHISHPDGKQELSERGELQLADYGISGIPVFQMAGAAAYLLKRQKELKGYIDFLPDMTEMELKNFTKTRISRFQEQSLEAFCTGLLNKKIMQLMVKRAGLKGETLVKSFGESKLLSMMLECKKLPFTVFETGAFQNAQVCAGGVSLKNLSENCEVKKIPGLYVTGELMDVDGRCGGYNLQWAWTTGYLAGRSAAEE